MNTLFQTWLPYIIDWSLIVLKALTILSIGWIASNWIASIISNLMKKTSLETTVRRSLQSFIKISLKTIVFVILLNSIGIKMTVITAIIGGVSISLGLALKNNISNVANGILLLITKPFKVGDSIESGSVAGTVERINIFTTELKTYNNQKLIVPNSELFNSSVINFSEFDTRRIELSIGLSYSDNIEKGTTLLKNAIKTVPTVLTDPDVAVYLVEFGKSSINYTIRAWCNRADFLATRHEMIIALKKACDENGLSIPFPQRDITLKK